MIKTDKIQERKNKILQYLIYDYVNTLKPVGSDAIAEKYALGISSASIRKHLSELESEGYLTHPHTSAGRVPTDKGYRFYVDNLMELQRLATEEKIRLQQEYMLKIKELEKIWASTSRLLAITSHYAGFVVTPRLKENVIKYFELLPWRNNEILIISVTSSGIVKHMIIKTNVIYSENELRYFTDEINENYAGLKLNQIKVKIDTEQKNTGEPSKAWQILLKRIIRGMKNFSEEEIYLEGTTNILSLPEFSDYQKSCGLLKIAQNKEILYSLLKETIDNQHCRGTKVTIGVENIIPEFNQWSLVSSVYDMQKQIMGLLGIIGPKSMNYGKMVAIVDYVTTLVNKALKNIEGEKS